MIRSLALVILIYLSQFALATDDMMSTASEKISPREIATISEIIPDFEDLCQTVKCEGAPACGQFTDEDSCLDGGEALGCFWSCK